MFRTYFSIFILITALAGATLFVWPKYQILNSLRADIKTREIELRSKTEYFDNIRRISEELKAYEASLAKISSALPADPLLPDTFNFLQNAASQAGLVLEEVSVGDIATFDGGASLGAKAISLSIELGGSYESLKSFLAAAEQSARLIEIKNIHFEESEEDEPFSFKLDILVYYY